MIRPHWELRFASTVHVHRRTYGLVRRPPENAPYKCASSLSVTLSSFARYDTPKNARHLPCSSIRYRAVSVEHFLVQHQHSEKKNQKIYTSKDVAGSIGQTTKRTSKRRDNTNKGNIHGEGRPKSSQRRIECTQIRCRRQQTVLHAWHESNTGRKKHIIRRDRNRGYTLDDSRTIAVLERMHAEPLAGGSA